MRLPTLVDLRQPLTEQLASLFLSIVVTKLLSADKVHSAYKVHSTEIGRSRGYSKAL
jgi:hypothetical protein